MNWTASRRAYTLLAVGALLAGLSLGCSPNSVAKNATPGGSESPQGEGGTKGGTVGLPAGQGPAGAPCTTSARRSAALSVANDFGVLSGTLELPQGCGPFPTLLILAGSGPTNRDGNSSDGDGVDTLKLLANALAEKGIASVRYDKAGVATSLRAAPAREQDLSFDMYVDDAERWVTALRQDARVSQLSIAGHSEGALIGMLAAKRLDVAAYISLAGAGRNAADLLREQLARQFGDAATRRKINDVLSELLAGNTVDVAGLPANLAGLFRPSVQPYLISWMKYDPAKELSALEAPTLIVQGTTDIQVSVQDAQLLAAAKPDATLLVVVDMMHELKHATSDAASQQLAYTDASLPVVRDVVDRCADFVLEAAAP